MKKIKKTTPFYVIKEDVNAKKFIKYDVMPYLIECYNETKKGLKPITFDEFKQFVKDKSMYMYWSRCQHEIVLKSLVAITEDTKVDIHWQILNNIDVITEILMKNVGAYECN